MALIFLILVLVIKHPIAIFFIVFPLPFIIVTIFINIFSSTMFETFLDLTPIKVTILKQIATVSLYLIVSPLACINISLFEVTDSKSIFLSSSHPSNVIRTILTSYLLTVLLLLYFSIYNLLNLCLYLFISVCFRFSWWITGKRRRRLRAERWFWVW